MKDIEENILKTTKEIVVKFIEVGRLSPSTIHESFRDIYATISQTVKANQTDSQSAREDAK
ncbi:MAG: conjugal transfer protein TraB, partial [Desulfamplus sp.]|nr:conjugal transfer protein TraB [Desulfamplus sp.]